MMRFRLVRVAGVLLVAAAFAACAPGGAGRGAAEQVPKAAPDFALQDLAGKPVKLSDSAGRVRLIDFWATWCPPCREAIPDLNELHASYAKDGLTILGISMDDEPSKIVPPFAEKYKIQYTLLAGTEDVADKFGGVFGLPTTILIDQNGNVAETWIGGIPKDVIEKRVRELLKLPAA